MALKAVHDTLEEIPEQYQDLYTEKGDKFELTGIVGVKTQADIDRLQTSLHKAQQDNKDIKASAGIWGDLDHADVMAKLDRIPELEAAAKGNLDESAIEEIVNRRTEGTIQSKLAPVERELGLLKTERDALLDENSNLKSGNKKRSIHDKVRQEMVKSKVIPEAYEDALMLSERIFEIREDDGAIVTKDGMGVTPGITADIWLTEIQDKRPHWWALSGGGGAGGGNGRNQNFGSNPFSAEHWNMTKQGQVLREQGTEKAEAMAKAAGTKVGGPKPKAKA